MRPGNYHLNIHWLTLTGSAEGRVIEEGDFPVNVQACTVEDARKQVLRIADRMSLIFIGTPTQFFYQIKV